GGFALGERRIIEEGEAHGAFDFEGAVAGEKHRGRVRVDALDRTSTTRCMVGEKRKHLLLALALAHARHPCAAIIRPPPVMTQLPHVLKRIRLNSLRFEQFVSARASMAICPLWALAACSGTGSRIMGEA